MQRIALALTTAAVLTLTGCTPPEADFAYQGSVFVEKPDAIVVRPFAPTFDASKKDSDKIPNWVLTARAEPQTQQDVTAGEVASETLAKQIVADLKARGLPAVAASSAPSTTLHTAYITGQFVNAQSATSTVRPAVGYRAGKAVETRVQLFQGSNFLGELKCNAKETDLAGAAPNISRQIADMIVRAYVMRGWLPPPPSK